MGWEMLACPMGSARRLSQRKQKYPEMPKLWWAIDKAAINHEAISFMSERRMPVTQAANEFARTAER
jgi:hypothetical protein